MTELTEWDNFYGIVGSATGSLIGLQFVALTLVATRPPGEGGALAGAAFATPTIVHFCTVLFLSAALRAPWPSVISVALFLGLVALLGVVYVGIVTRRMRRQKVYQPVFEDWLFHALLPLVAYATLLASALAVPSHIHGALFGAAAASLLLLFIAIHNAWDAVVYHVLPDE